MPANMLDHGFYNYSSTFLADFYRQAGWEQVDLHYLASTMAETGADTLYLKIAPGALGAPPGGFWFGLFGRFRKLEGAGHPIVEQGLYQALHDAWTRTSRAESQHEAPPPRPADGLRRLLARLRAKLAFARARRQAARIPGELVVLREPPR